MEAKDKAAAAIDRGLGFLNRARASDGAWGYLPEGSSRAEPTILVVAAGLPVAKQWLDAQPKTWPFLLLPALAYASEPEWSRAIAQWVASQRGAAAKSRKAHFDGTIPGWSWTDGAASWVVPTAYAVMSLSVTGVGGDRLAQGREMLRDRRCDDGGWNYGNPGVLGQSLPSQLLPTGWAALAFPSGDEAVAGALKVLRQALDRPSSLSLSLGIWALQHHGLPVDAFVLPLTERITASDGVRGRVDLTALAVTALQRVVSAQ